MNGFGGFLCGGGRWLAGLAALAAVLFAGAAYAQVGEETQFILNTFSFLIWGVLVMWMCAGFTMLEAGSVRTKNASVICLKNIGLYSIAGVTYYVIGYNLMYVDVGDLIGSFKGLYGPSAEELSLLALGEGASEAAVEAAKSAVGANGYAVMSDWFFQMVFVAHHRLHCLRRLGGAGETLDLLRLHGGSDRRHISHRRRLDLGRRLACPMGFPGFRRLHHRPLHRRLGGLGRRFGGGAEARQVQEGTAGVKPTPPSNIPRRHSGRFHPLVGVVRLQRRLRFGHVGHC